MQEPVISILVFQTVFCTTSGLLLGPSTDLTLQSFSLTCDFDGALWTSSLQFSFNGSTAGGCGSPPNPVCGSTVGSITRQALKNATLTLDSSKILTHGTALWQCTHAGLSPGEYNTTVIAVCSDGTVEQNGDRVDIRCTCGFPSVKATIKYKMSGDSKDPKVVDLQSSTGNSCIDDPRAMNFSYKEDISPGIEELCVSFTTLSQISESKEICRSIACTGSFHCGFWLVWLIVVVACVIICIVVWKKELKIEGFFQRKEINVAIFIGVAIIVAIVIGVILGIVMKCFICVTAVGVSIGVGLFIVVVLLIFIIVWNCKKEFYRAVIKITSETYTDELGDCKSEAYKNLSDRVIKAIESLYKNVEGRQTVMEINFSPGLKVTFDLSSQGFSDCSVLSDTLEIALQSGVISPFKVSSVGFEFMPLQDWKESKGETSDRSNGDRARNKSHNKPTGKKTEESSLHIKSYGSPLPEVPKVRHNKLDPIGETDNKPYTKLYGSPLPEVPQGRSIPLVPIQRQDIDEMESPKVEKKKRKKKKKKREDSVDNEEDN